ncbi:PTS system mannose/fructose/sorbose family transporter subunit IID [Sporolactobacillus shoreicorticis]|uniref:PTS system mannose/fructose/sorbose family transporter subunit IID n=1 Tax=Sporolactobacillus shoreicorticis TaxID=1923877 RepID=A0ABW5S064_9BACL|nr:PTS system mannose/fructose/sorbose family transporter subunit IID [Sporolactobacillus shoreicorticis]MCO7124687.1 PTS system mannose/fructose/sorbose family transporter subunit IID [Sporolactobacillus shoreicorticis]
MNDQINVPANIKNKTLRRFVLFGSCGSLNYEKMQGLSYCYAMYPTLKYIYKDDPEALKKAVLTHLQFYNTNVMFTPFIMGVDIGIEETQKRTSLKTIPSIKTSLMGPLAGLGDTLLLSAPSAIFGGIAASMAVKGNILGALLWLAVMIVIKLLVIPFFKAGYSSGVKLISTLKDQLQSITGSISIVGLMVVGSLISTVVTANVTATYHSGKLALKGQEILNSIMPGLIPAALVLLVFWLLGRKSMTPVRIILLVLILAVVLSAIGFLG